MVKASTATTGTGTAAVGSAVSPYRGFTGVVADGAIVRYLILDGSAWERGYGVYDSGAGTLTRVLECSSTGSLLNLSGAATIEIVFGAADCIQAVKRSPYDALMSDLPTQESTGLSTWVNQSNASVADTPVGMTIHNPSTSSGAVTGLKKSASGISSVTALAAVTATIASGSYGNVMIGLTDGTKFELFGIGARGAASGFTHLGRFTDFNTWQTNIIEEDVMSLNSPIWLRILLSGGNTKYQWSADGYNFITSRSHSTSEFLASADSFIFAANKTNAAGDTYATLMSWAED